MNTRPKKLVLVGDINSGKTWLWKSYFQRRLPDTYTQTIFDNHCTSVRYSGKDIAISLFETCGEEDYSNLRKIIYPGTDVIIFCVGIDTNSLGGKSTAVESWSQELKKHCKGIPILLVGTKKDIRDNVDELLRLAETNQKPLKPRELSNIAKKLKASGVIECSAKTGEGLDLIFQNAMKLTSKNKFSLMK